MQCAIAVCYDVLVGPLAAADGHLPARAVDGACGGGAQRSLHKNRRSRARALCVIMFVARWEQASQFPSAVCIARLHTPFAEPQDTPVPTFFSFVNDIGPLSAAHCVCRQRGSSRADRAPPCRVLPDCRPDDPRLLVPAGRAAAVGQAPCPAQGLWRAAQPGGRALPRPARATVRAPIDSLGAPVWLRALPGWRSW